MDKMSEAPELVVLYVCRHGETTLNASGCFRGNKDVPLNKNGIKDAHNLKKLFEDIPLSFVLSSDRIRATQTADILHQGKTIPKMSTESLRALNVGELSGKPRNDENIAFLQHYLDHPTEKIPEGESLADFKSRIRPAVWEAFETADDSGLPGLVVAHSSIVHEIGDMFEKGHKSVLVEPGGVVAIYIKNGKIGAQQIYRPMPDSDSYGRADTVS